jgi:hypothetical protein
MMFYLVVCLKQVVSWKDVPMEPLWKLYSLRSNSRKKIDVDKCVVMFPETREETEWLYIWMECVVGGIKSKKTVVLEQIWFI